MKSKIDAAPRLDAPSQFEPVKARKSKLIYILGIVAVIGIVGAIYAFSQLSSVKNDPQKAAEKETAELIAKVGKLIVLPTDEQPTVATVSDAEKLKDQQFFARAKNGDKVLIYTQSRKAILYDEVNNKIVEVAPVNLGEGAQ